MTNYIKREDAIEQARRNWIGEGEWIASTEIQLLKNLPTADVRENIRGKWKIYCDDKGVVQDCYCDQCGFNSVIGGYFCPNCGADMRGEL